MVSGTNTIPFTRVAGRIRFFASSSTSTTGAPTEKRSVCSPIRSESFWISGLQYLVAPKVRARSLVET